jgi:glucose/arabinose dehydrogenase/mono/diheme cytochrome c family protein
MSGMRRALVTASCVISLGIFAAPLPALSADAAAGKALFRRQCSICHSAEPGDNGGAQGPTLIGVYGRHAAGAAGFSYTAAMRAAGLDWDAPTLNRFLASPATVVPGSAMVVAVPSAQDRSDLIAYFQDLSRAAAAPAAAKADTPQSIDIPSASALSADWRQDAPGRTHRINLAALPPPFATPSSRNGPQLTARPPAAVLAVPPGFHADVFAANLKGPRRMLLAANGDILVTEPNGGRISVLHPAPDGARAAGADVYVQGLKQPFGLAFYPNAGHPRWLYVAETNRVTRYPYRTGDVKPRGHAESVIPLLPSGGGHSSRDIAFSPDGAQLFVSVGSASNVADTMSKKTPQEIAAWDSEHGLGASWDQETERAAVLVFNTAAPGAGKIYATGLRNCVGLTIQPRTGSLWCTTNERDGLGDDLVPDYSTRVQRGGFYGWPWYYMGSNEEPRLKSDRPDLRGKVLVPDVPYQAHSASLGLTFYTASKGKSAFPAGYIGDGFAAFHGSWNRSLRTGYKLVRVHMKDNQPTGDYEDFLTGFIVDNGDVWGRPVATTELKDGSLLLSDDGGNIIYRIWYDRPPASAGTKASGQ